jgi:hypothetical protein
MQQNQDSEKLVGEAAVGAHNLAVDPAALRTGKE